MSFRTFRIVALLLILVMVVHHQITDRARFAKWDVPVFVAVYPVNADGSAVAARYIERLEARDFEPIISFVRRQASAHGVELERPMYIELGDPIRDSPPAAPVDGNFLQRAAWVAKMRWWRWRFDDQGLDPDIIVMARYFDPDSRERLPHSTGIETIRFAIANLFAARSQQGANRVVLLHEIFHALGATDKYDLETGLPIYPAGYAEPERNPVLPQQRAELMAGRIPVTETEARQAEGLARVVVGPVTAAEVGWTRR